MNIDFKANQFCAFADVELCMFSKKSHLMYLYIFAPKKTSMQKGLVVETKDSLELLPVLSMPALLF